MRKSILTILTICLTVGAGYFWMIRTSNRAIVQAIGDVSATFPSSPLFMVSNWLPGDSESKSFSVNNAGTSVFQLAIRIENEVSTPVSPDLASITEVVISDDDGVIWYGNGSLGGIKTLANWYNEPYVMLGNINPGETRQIYISVVFPSNAENEYQLTQTQFDIVLMEEIVGPDGEQIPGECSDIAFAGAPIMGTSGNDRLFGNLKNNLIFGLDGNDMIFGNGGDDCIVGGLGDDRVMGGTGKDFIWGNEGNDQLDGGSDEDKVWGGDGNDDIDGGSDNDILWGGNGVDKIDGGSGNDYIYAEGGNDIVKGGSGIDYVWGGDGNDDIDGGTSNDYLYGDNGQDVTNGSTGTDTCVAEVKIKCEL